MSSSDSVQRIEREIGTPETKPSWKTTELLFYLFAVTGVLIASAVIDRGEDGQWFTANRGWTLVTYLTIGYMISRGLAKLGNRYYYTGAPTPPPEPPVYEPPTASYEQPPTTPPPPPATTADPSYRPGGSY